MYRLTVMLKRRGDLTREQFLEHWQQVHGPLIVETPELARHLVRYEQHIAVDGPVWAGAEGYDGVAVQYYAELADFEAFLSEPAYAELIAPDEERFLDRSGLVWLFTEASRVLIGEDRTGADSGGARDV